MTIRQRQTPLDGVLLKVVFPLLHESRLGRRLYRLGIWHHPVPLNPPRSVATEDSRARVAADSPRPLLLPAFRAKRAA